METSILSRPTQIPSSRQQMLRPQRLHASLKWYTINTDTINGDPLQAPQGTRSGVDRDKDVDDAHSRRGAHEDDARTHDELSDSGLRLRRQPEAVTGSPGEPGVGTPSAPDPESAPDADDCGEAPGIVAEEAMAQIVEELEDANLPPDRIARIVGVMASYEWCGRIPSPQDLAAYPEPVQERILSWEDAFSSDESHRQDRYVEAEIAAERRGAIGSMVLFAGCLALAACAFFVKDSVEGALVFVSLPVLGLIGRFLRPLRQTGKRQTDNPTSERTDK